jgi:uncharacterized protein
MICATELEKLQRIIYLANCAGWSAIKDYRFYYYGPYSDYVLSEIQDMSEEGLINIETMRYGNKSSYSHKLTEKGHLSLQMISERIKKDLFENTERLVKKSKFSSDELEIMASLYYLKLESPSLRNSQLMQELKLRKPHFSNQQINKSLVIFDIMKENSLSL